MDEMNNNVPQQGGYTAPQQGAYTAPQQSEYTAPQQGAYTAPQQSEYTAPQQGAYNAPVYNAPVETKANNTLGIIALICGIVSVVSTCCCGWFSFPTAIAGIVCAIIDKNKNGNMTTMAKVGMILGIVGIVLAIVSIILSLVLGGISGMMSALSELSNSSSYYYY